MRHGIISIAVLLTTVLLGKAYWNCSRCNAIAGRSPAIMFDLSDPLEHLNQLGNT